MRVTSLFILTLFVASPCAAEFGCSLPASLEFAAWMNPPNLQGDFNNDGTQDVAALVQQNKSKKVGIAICDEKQRKLFLVGAGQSLGNGGDDFSWMDHWDVRNHPSGEESSADAPPPYKGDALFVEKSESASAVIYFDGKRFQWYQQGD